MSVFPFINPVLNPTPSSTELPVFREYAYDFENNTLRLMDGKTYMVEGNEALRIWIFFALGTARFRYMAYDRAYGSEIEDQLIGQTMDDEITQSELERYITEALMVNPYIEELSEFDFMLMRDSIKVSFMCRSVYGTEQMHYVIKGVVL